MLIFVLQEIFRITKKKKKECWGTFKAIQGSESTSMKNFSSFSPCRFLISLYLDLKNFPVLAQQHTCI